MTTAESARRELAGADGDETGATSGGDGGGDGRVGGARRRGRLALAGAVAAIVLFGALVTWLVAFSSVLGVRTVDVRGTHTISAAQVRAAAEITDGTPLVRLDTAAIAKRVQALREVATARVTTSYPSTVIIAVAERVGVGVVNAGNGYLLVDRTGTQFRRVSERPPRLPLFVIAQGTAGRTTGSAVAAVAAALPAGLRGRVASIQALDPDAITLLLNNSRVVRWGSAARSADKARVLSALLHQSGTQFDVTDPDQPFTR